LNLSALDDTDRKKHDDHNNNNNNNNNHNNNESIHGQSAADFIPETLRSSRKSVSEIVKQPHVASRIRLDGMADALWGPLDQLLGDKRYLLSEHSPSSLDCLAVAYLALALIPVLPEPWLAESMGRYPRLCAYVHELRQRFFGGSTDMDGAIPTRWSGDAAGSPLGRKQESPNDSALPWKESRHESWISPGSAAAVWWENTLISVPVVGEYWTKWIVPPGPTGGSRDFKADTSPTDGIFPMRAGVVAAGTAVAALASYLFYLHPAFSSSSSADDPRSRRANQPSEMGEAGTFLAKARLSGDEHFTEFIVS
jgi:sorting and assembly machinery component 37